MSSAQLAAQVKKLFVLDTNVLMHDPIALYCFEEHDVFLPIVVLEELDRNKKGNTEPARNSREASRILDAIMNSNGNQVNGGIGLSDPSRGRATGKLFFSVGTEEEVLAGLSRDNPDNQILATVSRLQKQYPDRSVILVSKDINMRIKAHMLGLEAQDYKNDQVVEDTTLLPTGSLVLPSDFWDSGKCICTNAESRDIHRVYTLPRRQYPNLLLNQFVCWEVEGEKPFHAFVYLKDDEYFYLRTFPNYMHVKNIVWNITARNREQKFALYLLMNPEIDFVTLLGQAGTGKTLLTLAAGLTQVLEMKRYDEIIMTRATVPVGEDIGFLPGTEEEKMGPWMGALEDNLEVLNQSDNDGGAWGRAATHDFTRSRIKIKSLNFMRGRTFFKRLLIIDEAQNLTPKQMGTLITRAGPGTKVVCLGNLAQIDTPYLTEGGSGLAYAVERFQGWPHAGHITLQRGERSRLADYASKVL